MNRITLESLMHSQIAAHISCFKMKMEKNSTLLKYDNSGWCCCSSFQLQLNYLFAICCCSCCVCLQISFTICCHFPATPHSFHIFHQFNQSIRQNNTDKKCINAIAITAHCAFITWKFVDKDIPNGCNIITIIV